MEKGEHESEEEMQVKKIIYGQQVVELTHMTIVYAPARALLVS